MIIREILAFKDYRCPIICKKYVLMPHKRITMDDGNWHDDIEFICISKGNAIVRYNQEKLLATEGDTVIINSNVVHTITAKDSVLEYICLIVSFDFCAQNYLDTSYTMFEKTVHDEQISNIMNQLHSTHPTVSGAVKVVATTDIKNTDILLKRRALVLQLFSYLYSNFRVKGSYQTNFTLHSGIKRALDFTFKECHRTITLDEISSIAGLNKHYFSREFRKVTNCSYITYINQLRCQKAIVLLLNTDLSIRDISIQCGFSDQAYFDKVFSKHYGITPSGYRKENFSFDVM